MTDRNTDKNNGGISIIFCTGGVISSLGKGIASASLGRLLKSRGFDVGIMKLDPYINVDPGTMSPFQHGEVYVTSDGAETDLDLGHYERFLDVDLTREHNVTTGKIYDTVIRRERAGDYLGKTVQVIPHVTDEIKKRIVTLAERYDILIVEVGGTVGDIESLPFLEAIRQLRRELAPWRKREEQKVGRVVYLHLTLVPFQKASGEMKTKPTQHSVAALRQIGIQPQAILCRSETALEADVKEKIALFADVDREQVISLPDVPNIYHVPGVLRDAELDRIVLEMLGKPLRPLEMEGWDQYVSNLDDAAECVTVGIVGKYVELQDAYKSIVQALTHSSALHKHRMEIRWIDSEDLGAEYDGDKELDGMLVPGGFGERGVQGKIGAIRWCRENSVPYFGICLGLQCAVIEFARNVCGLPNAHSVEFAPDTPDPVIHIMESQKEVTTKGGTMRLGDSECVLEEGSRLAEAYAEYAGWKEGAVIERHRHRYEVNESYRDRMMEKGMVFSMQSPGGKLVEALEVKDHPFFVATQFHPEFRSRPLAPHPVFAAFVAAAVKRRQQS